MTKQTILLIFGGESSEHEVSIASARNVFAAIDNTKFSVELCYIEKNGTWRHISELTDELLVEDASKLVPMIGEGYFISLPGDQTITPDVILPVLHGKNGEDGSVQGLAQLLHVPIVGCDVTASAVCMDKVITKEVLKSHDISVVPYRTHRIGEPLPDFNDLELLLGMPMFVKPARAGSSVGVSKVFTEYEFTTAIATAHKHDTIALIEQGVSARELEVALLGNPPNHTVSEIGEIMPPDDDFYSYDEKYAESSNSQVIIPASLQNDQATAIRRTAQRVYSILGCSGLARVDFFLTHNGTLYVNEVNTFPGFTNISMYPKLWQHQGISYANLIEQMIETAINKE